MTSQIPKIHRNYFEKWCKIGVESKVQNAKSVDISVKIRRRIDIYEIRYRRVAQCGQVHSV